MIIKLTAFPKKWPPENFAQIHEDIKMRYQNSALKILSRYCQVIVYRVTMLKSAIVAMWLKKECNRLCVRACI